VSKPSPCDKCIHRHIQPCSQSESQYDNWLYITLRRIWGRGKKETAQTMGGLNYIELKEEV